MHHVALITLVTGLGLPLAASAFDYRATTPAFTVSVPGLPALAMSESPERGPAGERRSRGGDTRYGADIVATPAGHEVGTRECAGQFLRALVARPGMPARDSIYRAPLSAQTFLVIYGLGEGADQAWHAHLLAATGQHCVEAHFQRAAAPGEDADDWRKAFLDARIEPGTSP